MKLLIIGGSRFVGYYIVESALARGHEVTMFNRGQSNPGAFDGVDEIHGDRDGGLDALAGRRWDAVVDTCGYVPRVVRASAQFLQDVVDLYCFISTVSVYSEFSPEGTDEDGPLATIDDETTEEITGETYGALKVLCENVVQQTYPTGALIIRPGLIVGPRDITNRFGYWVERIARGGAVLAPGDPQALVQFIDVRDLAAWTVRMIEAGKVGVFNAVGPREPMPMGDYLDVCRRVTGSDAEFTWVPDQFLLEHDVSPWVNLPLWLPDDDKYLHLTSNQRAVAEGLTYHRVEETVRDTLEWLQANEVPQRPNGPISAEREAELLKDWRQG